MSNALENVVKLSDTANAAASLSLDRAAASSVVTSLNAYLAAHAGETVILPAGNYLIDGTVTVPRGTALIGEGGCDVLSPGTSGVTFFITHTSGPAILLGRGARLEKCAFWYPDQVTTGSPTIYDYTIASNVSPSEGFNGNNAGITIADVVIHNAYNGINLDGDSIDGSPNTGATYLTGIQMFALNIGIKLATTASEMRWSDIVFSPLVWNGSTANSNEMRKWAINNGTACILITHGQGPQLSNVTFFGHRRGIFLENAGLTLPEGNITFIKATGCIFDGLMVGIEATGCMGFGGSTFTGCHFAARNPYDTSQNNARGVFINQTIHNHYLMFSGCTFLSTAGDHVRVETADVASVAHLMFSGCHFYTVNANSAAGTYRNFYVDMTQAFLTVIGCQVMNLLTQSQVVVFDIQNARYFCSRSNLLRDAGSKSYNLVNVNWFTDIDDRVRPSTTDSTFSSALSSFNTVASAATITLPAVGGLLFISGTTGITSITASWPGRLVVLKFNGALTLTDGSNLKLAGNFTTSADDTLTLVCDGTNWYEVARAAN